MESLQPGDLIFYPGTEENMADHVGIYIGADRLSMQRMHEMVWLFKILITGYL